MVTLVVSGRVLGVGYYLGGAGTRPAEAVRTRGLAGRSAPNEPPAGHAPSPLGEPVYPEGMGGACEPQAALLLTCNELARDHPETFAGIVGAAGGRLRILGLVNDRSEQFEAEQVLAEHGGTPRDVEFVQMSYDTMWVRDYGPMFVRLSDGEGLLVNADYTMEIDGGDLPGVDDEFPDVMASATGARAMTVPVRLQGGNVLSNGDGLCVTSTWVFSENEGLGKDPNDIAAVLGERMGMRRWLFVTPLAGEQTRHVDMFLTFLAPGLAVVGQFDANDDPVNAGICDAAAELLAEEMTSRGPMRVVRIPMPKPDGDVFRSYTNVVFANGVLLVPTYNGGDPALEQEALDLYRRLMPGWQIAGVNCDALIGMGGALHCVVLNIPSFAPLPHPRNSWADTHPGTRDLPAPIPIRTQSPAGAGR